MGEENQGEQKPQNKILVILIALFMSIYGFYTMIVAIIAYADYQNLATDFDYLLAEFKGSPIVGISTSIANQQDCSNINDPLYEFVSIFNYTFAGTNDGCDCRAITTANSTQYDINKTLYSGSCVSLGSNYTSSGAGCIEEPAIPTKNFVRFGASSSAGAFFCAKKPKNYPFHKKAGRKNGNCPGDDKKCPFGTKGDYYCVPRGSDCPILGLQVTTSSTPNTGYTLVNSGGAVTYESTAQHLHMSTSIDASPINVLLVGERDKVCSQFHRRRLLTGVTSDYLLMKDTPISEADCKVDERFKATDFKVSESNFFTRNDIPNTDFIDRTYSTTAFYTFFNRNFLQWKIEAREDLEKLIDTEEKIRSMNTYQLLIMLFTILTCLMVSVILTFSELYNVCGKDVPCIDGEGDEEKQKIKRYKKGCGYCGKFLQAPFAILAFAISNGIKSLLRGIADQKPGDEITNGTLDRMATQVEDKVWMANLQILIGLIIAVLVDIAMYIKERMDKKKQADKINAEPAKNIEMNNTNQPIAQVITPQQQPQQIIYVQQPQQQQQVIMFQQPMQQTYFNPMDQNQNGYVQ